jgi:hypothetical protein
MKFIAIVCLTILLVFSCTKDNKNIRNFETESSIYQNIEESKIDSIILNEENEFTEINDDRMIFLTEYFPDGNYHLLERPLDVNYRKIDFAVHYIDNDRLISDKIIGFEIVDGLFQRYLLVNDFCFVNIDDSTLLDFSKGYAGIYGFTISYSYPRVDGYTPGLNIDTYFDNGKRVADGITVMWDENNKKFKEVIWF